MMDEYGRDRRELGGVFEVTRPIFDARGWIKLLGIVYIINGVICCLSIIGLLIGWLPIWMGILMVKASNNVGNGFLGKDERSIREGLDQLRINFKIQGILMIISLVFTVLYIIGIAIFLVIGAANGGF
jgi:hypothetical protein